MTALQHVAAALAVIALGLIFLIVLGLRGVHRFVFAALIGIATAVLIAPALPIGKTYYDLLILVAAGAAFGLAAATLFLALLAFDRKKLNNTIGSIVTDISPSLWEQPSADAQRVALTHRDTVRRWYVAVGAATGATVGCLVTLPEFHGALLSGFSGPTLFSVAVATVASTVLIGPVQAYVTSGSSGTDEAAEAAASLGWFDFDNMTARSGLRVAMIAALFLAVSLLFSCLEEAVEKASFNAAATIVLASLAPGVVSWYWSAALQTDTPASEIAQVASRAATSCGAVIYYPWGVMAVITLIGLSGREDAGAAFVFVASPLLGMLLALILASVVFGLPAWIGGSVLSRFGGWTAMAMLAVALVVVTLAIDMLIALGLWILTLPDAFDWGFFSEQTIYTTFGMIGWVLGLVAGGFPQLVSRFGQVSRRSPLK